MERRREEVRGTHEALRAKGVSFLGAPTQVCSDETSVGLSADFHDLDGNQFSILGNVPK